MPFSPRAALPRRLQSSETYYILEGTGEMRIDEGSVRVQSGQLVCIPPNSTQSIQNIGKTDLKFLCIVDPAWRPEDETVL